MSDASWGYTAQQGLEANLGGKDIDKINKKEGAMSPEEMQAYIMAAPEKIDYESKDGYSDAARRFAKAILTDGLNNQKEFLENSKEFADKVYQKYDLPDLTGFMFGWAVNAVRYCLHERPIRNPAIVEIGVEKEE